MNMVYQVTYMVKFVSDAYDDLLELQSKARVVLNQYAPFDQYPKWKVAGKGKEKDKKLYVIMITNAFSEDPNDLPAFQADDVQNVLDERKETEKITFTMSKTMFKNGMEMPPAMLTTGEGGGAAAINSLRAGHRTFKFTAYN